MNEILPTIYSWFESLFGSNLTDFLWGYNCEELAFTGDIVFNVIGVSAIAVSLILVLAFYYWPLNHPRFNRWWSWLIIMLCSSLINLFIGYAITVNHLNSGNIGDCMMYTRDQNGEIITQLISESDCWMFGFANFIVSALFFLLLTLIFKWGSRNAKYSPFVKF